MDIIITVASETGLRSRNLADILLLVAAMTVGPNVGTGKRKVCLLVVIETPALPSGRAVAFGTRGCQPSDMMAVSMASRTLYRRVLE